MRLVIATIAQHFHVLLQKIREKKPKLVVIHFQEVGGKEYKTSMVHLPRVTQ